VSERTLSPLPELALLHVRRLLILLRRLALREGTVLAFQSNDDVLRRDAERRFDRVLGDLFVRGAFAGVTADQGYRVVANATVNPRGSVDQGRLIIELRVAPAQPMAFITVRLVQLGGELLAEEV
jgi:phage tail sheath protein FI